MRTIINFLLCHKSSSISPASNAGIFVHIGHILVAVDSEFRLQNYAQKKRASNFGTRLGVMGLFWDFRERNGNKMGLGS